MRFMKMIGLATMAAVASMALVGVGSAAAQEEHRVVFCKFNEELCKEGGAWPDETLFLGESLGEPTLLGALTEKCEESHIAGEVLSKSLVESLLVHIELLTFEGNCTPCNPVLIEGLPYEGHITHTGSGTYSLLVLNPLALLDNCPLVGSCGFAAEEVHIELSNEGGSILALANEAKLGRHSGSLFCGNGAWDAHYVNLVPVAEHGGASLGSAWLSLLDFHE
jgi:hypothetical protein